LSEGLSPTLHIVSRSYKWTYLYAAVEPTTGESFCLYLPGMDSGCLQSFLEGLCETYPDHHLLVVCSMVLRVIAQNRSSAQIT
jgi:hypothetical protein